MEASEKKPQEITVEEELPPGRANGQDDFQDLKSLDERIIWGKFSIGSRALLISIGLMSACILISLFKPENELVKSGFEAFKLIAMTLLGYMFGSNKSK